MKDRLLSCLACPTCGEGFSLRAARRAGEEIIEGSLACKGCSVTFPVSGGIPRFVSSEHYAVSFGFEWKRFSTVQLDSVNPAAASAQSFAKKTGLTPADVKGCLILDAGVGAGRFAEVVSGWGGEVVGVDISQAVEAAFANIGIRPNVHLVQADLFSLPFREDTFDVAYSIGVLHHTPDPEKAFHCVSNAVKKGGTMAVYVYPALGLGRHFSDTIRKVTTRLPVKLMFGLSALAVPLYYLYRLPLIGKVAQTVCPISLHRDWRWRWLDTFDWYTPKFQFKSTYPAVYRWFRDAGYTAISIFEEPICMGGVKDANTPLIRRIRSAGDAAVHASTPARSL